MHIRDWPEAERPREKLLAHGAGSLSDAELLAIFLGSGLPGRDAVQTARDLLAQPPRPPATMPYTLQAMQEATLAQYQSLVEA